MAGGGGLIGLVVVLAFVFLGGDPSSLDTGASDSRAPAAGAVDLGAECQTGADANQREDCRIVAVVNSVQAFWTSSYPEYQPALTTFFTGQVQTGCGSATSATGPFYCPVDERVYIDLGFYDELRSRFGANGGPFAEAYVIAHEYGHHVSQLQGFLDKARDGQTGPQSKGVRSELMADCYAGLWAKGAVDTGFIEQLTDADIKDGLDAASVIGDDRIQQQATGQVNPEAWTHGSSEQRQTWFLRGFRSGEVNVCNTFAANRV